MEVGYSDSARQLVTTGTSNHLSAVAMSEVFTTVPRRDNSVRSIRYAEDPGLDNFYDGAVGFYTMARAQTTTCAPALLALRPPRRRWPKCDRPACAVRPAFACTG